MGIFYTDKRKKVFTNKIISMKKKKKKPKTKTDPYIGVFRICEEKTSSPRCKPPRPFANFGIFPRNGMMVKKK